MQSVPPVDQGDIIKWLVGALVAIYTWILKWYSNRIKENERMIRAISKDCASKNDVHELSEKIDKLYIHLMERKDK